MTARVFSARDWIAARQRLAVKENGSRRTIRRGIYLRETADGRWAAHLLTWKKGQWQTPEVLALPTSYQTARAAAMAAWRATRMPVFYQRRGASGCVGFRPGIAEPVLGGAA